MNNADEVGAQLYSKLAEFLAPPASLAGTPVILLLEPCGKDVDPDDYRGVKNQNDPAKANEAFSDLVNTIPVPGSTFVDSSRLYDNVYKLIVESAVTNGDPGDPVSVNAARQIEGARFDIGNIVMAREDIPTDIYHPALADPVQWWDTATPWIDASFTIGGSATPPPKPASSIINMAKLPSLMWRSSPHEGNLKELAALVRPKGNLSLARARALYPQAGIVTRTPDTAINAPGSEKKISGLHTLASKIHTLNTRPTFETLQIAPAKLRYGDLIHIARLLEMKAPQAPAQPAGSGFRLSFQYCVVSIRRPWFHRELFDLPGWRLPGFATHAISNGQPTNNDGLLPAITTRFLAVRNLVVRAAWSDGDRDKAEQASKAAGVLSFGPFALTGDVHFDGTELRRSTPQIVAWLAAILPACPR
ncbi:Uncharacterised protein [uncultured archaeon]|nr:Uncharacterised protein [uncultured archaeon]